MCLQLVYSGACRRQKGMVTDMEKVYKAMKSAGSWNLALGITLIVAGCVTGIMLIVSGAKLLRKKKDLLF